MRAGRPPIRLGFHGLARLLRKWRTDEAAGWRREFSRTLFSLLIRVLLSALINSWPFGLAASMRRAKKLGGPMAKTFRQEAGIGQPVVTKSDSSWRIRDIDPRIGHSFGTAADAIRSEYSESAVHDHAGSRYRFPFGNGGERCR